MNTDGLNQWMLKSTIGELYLVASIRGLKRVFWSEQIGVPYLKDLSIGLPQAKILHQSVNELTEYFAGKRHSFYIPLDLSGTDFQMRVWNEVQKISSGNTKSYKEVALAIGSEANRAVGSANGRNPLCIIIPCHRVISSDGTLGGYSGGLERKKTLIALENKRHLK